MVYTHPSSLTDEPAAEHSSIVLVGARGTGRSTLAIIAWKSLHLQLVDIDDVFHQHNGVSRLAFKQQNGLESCRDREGQVLRHVFASNSKGYVIIYPSEWLDETSLQLLKQLSESCLVVHVVRCSTAVGQYLRQQDTVKVKRLLELSNNLFRTVTSFEFYNLDEPEISSDAQPDTSTYTLASSDRAPQPLRLKHLEENFVRFITSIRHPTSGSSFSSTPFPPPKSTYTYMLPVHRSEVGSTSFRPKRLNCGADICQLEIDDHISEDGIVQPASEYLQKISRSFAIVRSFFVGPILYKVSFQSLKSDTRCLYMDLLHHGLRLGADYVSVSLKLREEEIALVKKKCGSSKLIGDYHDNTPGPNGWKKRERMDLYNKARSALLDGVRLTQNVHSIEDNAAVTCFNSQLEHPKRQQPFLIAYNTGLLGRPSQCCNYNFTPVSPTEARSPSDDVLPEESERSNIIMPHSMSEDDWWSIQGANRALYSMLYFHQMQYYIVGTDVSYSVSPRMHNAAHAYFGMPHRMDRQSLTSLEELRNLIYQPHCAGISIAQGYKTSVLPLVSIASRHAQNIGAVNTIIPIRTPLRSDEPVPPEFWHGRNRAGPVLGVYGDNTDWLGIAKCILQNLSPANRITPYTTALVVGAGGMARAALYALVVLGVQNVVMYNRTPDHAKALAHYITSLQFSDKDDDPLLSLGVDFRSYLSSKLKTNTTMYVLESLEELWPSGLAPATIILSCIPASDNSGKQPGANFILPPHWMQSATGGVVVDFNYRPLMTPLLRQMHSQAHRGWLTVDGIESICAQASFQFELFTGRKVPRNFMRNVARTNNDAVPNDVQMSNDHVHL